MNCWRTALVVGACLWLASAGCRGLRKRDAACPPAEKAAESGPPFDRPFPLGQVTDSFWETQQTNAEASDFVFYDHEFVGDTVELAPSAERKLEQVALRLPHVPFPVVVEPSRLERNPELDAARRDAVVAHLAAMGLPDVGCRVVVAPALADGIPAAQGERAYHHAMGPGDGWRSWGRPRGECPCGMH